MKKVAVVRRNGLGDMICTFPLIQYLKKRGDLVTLFASEMNAELLPFLPPIDELVILPSSGNKYWTHFRVAIRYRKQFDVVISAKTSPMKLINFFLFCLGAKQQIAYVTKKWHRLWINKSLIFCKAKSKKSHQALKVLQMVAPELEEIPPELMPSLTISEKIKARYPLSIEGPVILMNASNARPTSRFDEKRYAALINRLYEKHPFSLLVCSLKKDEERAKKIQSFLKVPAQMHFPRNFEEFMVTLDACDLLFDMDGGVAHMGSALKKKGVLLYGVTNPLEWGPLSKEMDVFFHPEHVNNLEDEPIFESLERKLEEVICARNDLRSTS